MRPRLFLAAILLFHGAAAVHAADGETTLRFDGQRAKEIVAYLSSDEMQGRESCTEGFRRAADWSAEQFKTWGLAPAGEDGSYFQQVRIREFDWHTGVPSLQVGTRAFALDDNDFLLDSCSSPGVVTTAEVVFVGYGILAPQKGLNEYENLDVKGKIVLVLTGSPKDAPALRDVFAGDDASAKEGVKEQPETDWTAESTELAKIGTAFEQGAAAVLLYDPSEPAEVRGRRRSGHRPPDSQFKPTRDFLCFTVTERVYRAIMKRDPQESPRGLSRRTDAIRRAIKEKRSQSHATGVQVTVKGFDTTVRHSEEQQNNVARNVLAKIVGTDPQLQNEYVLVGAHLDHVGMRNGYVYNGADDNASGSAVVLELARTLAQAKYQGRRTLVFCLWCGEERGLIGSLHYTRQPCDGVDLDKVVAYFNLDMVGMGANLEAPGALNFPTIWDVIQRNQNPDIIKLILPSVGGPGGSDHNGFIMQGIEAMALMSRGGVGHQDYHQPEDDVEKIEPEMLRVSGQFVLQGMLNTADETTVNLIIPRRRELYEGLRMRIANFNPALEGSSWTKVDLQAENAEQLRTVLDEEVRKWVKESVAADGNKGDEAGKPASSRGRKSITRALASWKSVGTDARLLDLVIDLYGIGRADVTMDDPLWFRDAKLTEEGRQLIKLLQERSVVLHVISPGEAALKDLLQVASKPFVVSGDYSLREDLAQQLQGRGVLLAITLDPQDPSGFLERAEQLKKLLGERSSLFAMITSTEGLENAKQSLYLGLIDRGWARNEIVGGREHRGLMGGATLHKLAE